MGINHHCYRLLMLFILLTLGGQIPAYGKDIWIEVVGIDESSPKSNFPGFYEEAESFLKVCRQSRRSPECHLFVNKDLGLSSEKIPAQKSLLSFSKGPADKAAVLNLLKNRLQVSQPGDNVILTLTSHGFMNKESNSCIVLNSKESICEKDIAQVIQFKPQGARLFVNAEGCFSGAFVDVAGPEVCVAVRVDRRNGAVSAGGFFWDQVLDKKIKRLSGFVGPMGNSYTEKPLLASDAIKSLMCREARGRAYPNWPRDKSIMEALKEEDPTQDSAPLEKLAPEKNTRFFGPNSISYHDHDDLVRLNSLNAGFLEFLTQARTQFSCAWTGLGGDLCESLNSILSQDFFKQINYLNSLSEKMLEARGASLKKLIALHRSRLRELLAGSYGRAWSNIEPCLFNVEQTVTKEEEDYFISHRSQTLPLFPRIFTQQDIENARTCESAIVF